jgi:hypothetical protein
VEACESACRKWSDSSLSDHGQAHHRWMLFLDSELAVNGTEKIVSSRLDLVADLKPWLTVEPAVVVAYCSALCTVWRARPSLATADRDCGLASQLLSLLDVHSKSGPAVAAVFQALRSLVKAPRLITPPARFANSTESTVEGPEGHGGFAFSTVSRITSAAMSALSFADDLNGRSPHPPEALAAVIATLHGLLKRFRQTTVRTEPEERPFLSQFLVEAGLIESVLTCLERTRDALDTASQKAVELLQYEAAKLFRVLVAVEPGSLPCHHRMVMRGCVPVLLGLLDSQPKKDKHCNNVLDVVRTLVLSETELADKIVGGAFLEAVLSVLPMTGSEVDLLEDVDVGIMAVRMRSLPRSARMAESIAAILAVCERIIADSSFRRETLGLDCLPALLSAPRRLLRQADSSEKLIQQADVRKGLVEAPSAVVQGFWSLMAELVVDPTVCGAIAGSRGIPPLVAWIPYGSKHLAAKKCVDNIAKFYDKLVAAYVKAQTLSVSVVKYVVKAILDRGLLDDNEFCDQGRNHRVGHVIHILWRLLSSDSHVAEAFPEFSQLFASALVESGTRLTSLLLATMKHQGALMPSVRITASGESEASSLVPVSHGLVAVLHRVLDHTTAFTSTVTSDSKQFVANSFHYLTTMFAANYSNVEVSFCADGMDDEWVPPPATQQEGCCEPGGSPAVAPQPRPKSLPSTTVKSREDFWKQEFVSLEFLPLLVRLSSLAKVSLFDCPNLPHAKSLKDSAKLWNYDSRKICGCVSEKTRQSQGPLRTSSRTRSLHTARDSETACGELRRYLMLTSLSTWRLTESEYVLRFAHDSLEAESRHAFRSNFRDGSLVGIRKGCNYVHPHRYTCTLDRLFALMGYYHDIEKVQVDGCSLLHNLAIASSCSAEIVAHGGLVVIASALRNHPSSVMVVEAALSALCAFCRAPNAALSVSASNLPTRILEALKVHRNDPVLVAAFLKLLNTVAFVARAAPALVSFLSSRPIVSKLRALFRLNPSFPILDVLVKVDPEAFVFLDSFQRAHALKQAGLPARK